MTEWISVKDKLPESSEKCLILLKNNVIAISSYFTRSIQEKHEGVVCGVYYPTYPQWDIPEQWQEVTHWMPLPKPPEQ